MTTRNRPTSSQSEREYLAQRLIDGSTPRKQFWKARLPDISCEDLDKRLRRRGGALTKKGVDSKPVLPTKEETVILRRVAAGYCKVTMTEDGPQYSYHDGTPLPLKHFHRMVKNGWLIPDNGDTLFWDGPPQIYRARKP